MAAPNILPIDIKVSLVGASDTGKTSLIKFLKGMNF
jgi:GTPase SAR1 family protein